ncbi:hypothetical protein PHYBOEH_006793 [Phytophthora boehmeriae]|uniref:RxLR effector protein n=1 Tax=Phytophthora boehmeriae TaxID=109152 RepID=A0A8T1WEP1_9STRA|nr:hypothetical protein PHYBOEH_006793 [Phytophthora boehmeriae]
MRVTCFMVAAAAICLAVLDGGASVSALNHASHSKTASVNSGDVVNQNDKRFLRTRGTIEDAQDDVEEDEERNLVNLLKGIVGVKKAKSNELEKAKSFSKTEELTKPQTAVNTVVKKRPAISNEKLAQLERLYYSYAHKPRR